jgi:hypothetical protein
VILKSFGLLKLVNPFIGFTQGVLVAHMQKRILQGWRGDTLLHTRPAYKSLRIS